MTRETVKGKQNSIDQKNQRPNSNSETIRKIEGQDGVPPEKEQNHKSQPAEVSVEILQDEWKLRLRSVAFKERARVFSDNSFSKIVETATYDTIIRRYREGTP